MQNFRRIFRPFIARVGNEPNRVATQLELFFDLVIVIAFASIANNFHHSILKENIAQGSGYFVMAFVFVWWSWNLFTWFANVFDNDDVAYRLHVLLMMIGAMVIAAGLPSFFQKHDLTFIFIGYLMMRVALVLMWLRAGYHTPAMRSKNRFYIFSQFVTQIYWGIVVFVLYPQGGQQSELLYIYFAIGMIIEGLVPWFAERKQQTDWHRPHLAERFGLLNLIVLGEIMLGATLALQGAFSDTLLEGNVNFTLISYGVCGILIAFCLWWLYFSDEMSAKSMEAKSLFHWGFGHFFIFIAGVGTGVGLEVMNAVAVHQAVHGEHLSHPEIAIWTLSLPMALYIAGLWYVRDKHTLKSRYGLVLLSFALSIALTPLATQHLYLPTALLVLCLIVRQSLHMKRSSPSQ